MKVEDKVWREMLVDKAEMRRIVEEVHEKMGVPKEPLLTHEEVRQLMIADGVRPEDNTFSRGIIEARDEE